MNKKNKNSTVYSVFKNVADRYDIMNDLMSFSMHRIWKNRLIKTMNLEDWNLKSKEGPKLLDLAGGTGDIGFRFVKKCQELYYNNYHVTIADINNEMLEKGKVKMFDENLTQENIDWVVCNGEKMDFADKTFDYVTISFGIRNFSNIKKALKEMRRVLKDDGKFLCMEFINPGSEIITNDFIQKAYNFYSYNIIPKMGQLIVGDSSPYDYFVDSIRKFPKHQEFIDMIKSSGFTNIKTYVMNFGIVGLYYN